MITGEPRIDQLLGDIIGCASTLATWNHPLVRSGENVGGRAKPASRPPGTAQCRASVRAAEKVLEDARAKMMAVVASAKPHEAKPDVVVQVGGVKVRNDDGTFALDRQALAAKMAEVLEA